MRKSRFSEEQIIGILKEHQAGMPAAELCRKHGISDATFYTWRSEVRRDGGVGRPQAEGPRGGEPEAEEAAGRVDAGRGDAPRGARKKLLTPRSRRAGRDLGDRGEGLLAAARLRSDRHGAEDLSLCLAASRRCRAAPAPARAGEPSGGGSAIGGCTSCCGGRAWS